MEIRVKNVFFAWFSDDQVNNIKVLNSLKSMNKSEPSATTKKTKKYIKYD